MNYIGKFISNFKEAYNEINGATLTGAIDAVVVRQEDGTLVSSPFHVRFGKIGVLRSREKVVDIEINGESVDIHMKLGETGEAFFVEELEEGDEVSSFLGTSPIPNYVGYNSNEDDAKSQDSGVEAEEIICKSLKDKQAKEVLRKISRSRISIYNNNNNNLDISCEGTTVSVEKSSAELVSDVRIESKSTSNEEEPFTQEAVPHPSLGSSPSVDVPKQKLWREDLVRSKSLTTEPFRKTSCVVADGQGSKTDIEDTMRVNKTTRRRKKRRASSKLRYIKTTDSHSSDNSTTSEMVDLSSLSVTDVVPNHDAIFLMEGFENAQEDHSSEERIQQAALLARFSSKGRNWRRGLTLNIGSEFHPFSDTDISPPPSPGNSRSETPVKSDTEYECEKQKIVLSHRSSALNRDDKWSWTWGELPTPPVAPRPGSSLRQGHADSSITEVSSEMQSMTHAEDAQRSMLGNMFSFMRATKKARHNPESEGIYLDDLNLDELDPEVAALYFPRNSLLRGKPNYTDFRSVAKDEDVESGNGTSLPQSPHSVEGAIGGAKMHSVDSDFEESTSTRHPIFDYKGYHDLAFSLCGNLHEYIDEPLPESLFLQSLVTYDDFCENPNVIDSPHLVVRFGGKYMNWPTAAAQIAALALFQRPLPAKVADKLAQENMPKKELRKRSESKGYSWFSWGRNSDVENSQKSAFKSSEQPSSLDSNDGSVVPSTTHVITTSDLGNQVHPASVTFVSETTTKETYVATVTTTTSMTDNMDANVVKPPAELNDSSESDDHDDKAPKKLYRKTIRLSNDQIKKLNLRNGSNEVVFSVTTAYQGTTRCKCHIFLWNYDEKIVVSDIDGTITKSDVLGHILPIIGKDWAQGGVAQLFTKIKNNGYNFLYLSARAIGQARVTRDYLRSIKQGDVSLPDGPLLLNPTSLIHAFHREVIEKKPEEFKISCLRDIKALFPSNLNPFYAGYGNKINDVWAYSAVGIPIQRIFTINHRGELKHELTQTFQSSYSNLSDIVNHMFPPANEREIHDEFSSLQFWRPPLPDISQEIELAISNMTIK